MNFLNKTLEPCFSSLRNDLGCFQSSNQSSNQSINQSINRSIDQSINQSINQSSHHSELYSFLFGLTDFLGEHRHYTVFALLFAGQLVLEEEYFVFHIFLRVLLGDAVADDVFAVLQQHQVELFHVRGQADGFLLQFAGVLRVLVHEPIVFPTEKVQLKNQGKKRELIIEIFYQGKGMCVGENHGLGEEPYLFGSIFSLLGHIQLNKEEQKN